jgi:hypothetical protein
MDSCFSYRSSITLSVFKQEIRDLVGRMPKRKTKVCTFTLNANATVTANVL